ncbi:MAG: hypothetical protein AAB466_06205 [Verrucomicrobiota bacterium]
MSDLPKFIELGAAEGKDTVERWRVYLEALYGVYRRSLVQGELMFRGLRVGCRRIPEDKGKHFAFWHLVQEGYPEEDRTPDLERCRRLLWVSWVIRNAGQDAMIRVFPQTPRHGEKTWALWLFEHDYTVILAERSGYFLLKTAFMVKPDKREELERDWQESVKGKNG